MNALHAVFAGYNKLMCASSRVLTLPFPTHIKHCHVIAMKYYKLMLYSAMAIIYASLGFRIFRLSYISNQVGQRKALRSTWIMS